MWIMIEVFDYPLITKIISVDKLIFVNNSAMKKEFVKFLSTNQQH